METINLKCRITGEESVEKIYAEGLLRFLYSESRFFSKILCLLVARLPILSSIFGVYQKFPWTKKKIEKFIADFGIDPSEFEKTEFSSFNDFFIRKLKSEARPISDALLVAPADGRYRAYENASNIPSLSIKGKTFSLFDFLGKDEALFEKYKNGSLLLIRLAPPDYHRFHFPVDSTPSSSKRLGYCLFSVHPIALKQNFNYLSENKRAILELKSPVFGSIAYVPIGATNVGSIQFTYKSGVPYRKGDELGFFAFGGSCIVLLFEGKVPFASDLLENTQNGIETLCRMGSSLLQE